MNGERAKCAGDRDIEEDRHVQFHRNGGVGHGDRLADPRQALVIAPPPEPVAVIAGDEAAGVDIARVGQSGVVAAGVQITRAVATRLKPAVLKPPALKLPVL